MTNTWTAVTNDATSTAMREGALSLLGVSLIEVAEGPQPYTGEVLVILTWVGSDDSDAWPYFATAFDFAAAREYPPAGVFSQSAVEISMMPLVASRLQLHADRFVPFEKTELALASLREDANLIGAAQVWHHRFGRAAARVFD